MTHLPACLHVRFVRAVLSTLLFALTLPLGAATCEGGNTLDGSISEVVDLTFDEVQMRRFSSGAIQLDYLRAIEDTGTFDVVCKVVFDTPEGGIVVDEPIDIVANGGIIERVVAANETFPALDTANITFFTGGQDPGPVTGEFVSTFENGRTLNGTFETELEDVDF